MKKSTFLVVFLLFVNTAYAQTIQIDKTDRFGRLIATDYSEIYEESGREGEIALSYFQSSDSSSFFLLFKTQEDFDIRVGDKMLFKHDNGTITEIECVDNGSKSTHVNQFGMAWLSPNVDFYRSTDGVLYSITDEQLKTLAEIPVVKIRIEESVRYNDRKITNARGKSKISGFVGNALQRIKEALETHQTGPYDNF